MNATAVHIIDACRSDAAESVVITVGDIRIAVKALPDVMEAYDRFSAFAAVDDWTGRSDVTATIHVGTGDALYRYLPRPDSLHQRRIGRSGAASDLVVALTGDQPAIYAATADRSEAAVAFPDLAGRAWWERARPLLPAVQGLLRDTQWRVLHAAAIGNDAGATLLTGGSHAGKTTLSLTALLSGHRYFGDDVVAVSLPTAVRPARVARVYRTARLRLPPLAVLAPLVGEGRLSDEMGEQRSELHLGHRLAGTSVIGDLTRLVHVDRKGASAPTFGTVSRGRVLATVTSTTLQVGLGDLGHHSVIAEMCAALPVSGFDPGGDPTAAVRVLWGDPQW